MCVRAVKALARLRACAGASEHLMIKYSIIVKSLMSQHISFPFENSGCSLISVYAFVQSNQGNCDLHTQHMILKVCMHKVLLNHCRATYPKTLLYDN